MNIAAEARIQAAAKIVQEVNYERELARDD
jgi:hypothetical protein